MMRSLIAIAALVAFVPAKAGAPSGEVDGKGIICHSEESVTGEPEWYWFAQKRVTQSYIELMEPRQKFCSVTLVNMRRLPQALNGTQAVAMSWIEKV